MPFTTRLPKRPSRTIIPILASIFAILLMLLLLPRAVIPLPRLHASTATTYIRAPKSLPGCAATRAKTFLIVFQSRSGSTAISSHLKSHSQVHMTTLEYLDRLNIPPHNATSAIAATRKFFKEGIKKGLVPGFKIRPHHILGAGEKWAGLVREFDTRVIWQYRKNVVKSAIGTYQKEVLGDATAISGIRKDELKKDRCSMGVGCKFRIDDMIRFHDMLKKRVFYQDMISKSVNILDDGRDCTLEVPYEDYLYFPDDTVNDMLTFLGLDKQDTFTDRVKATSDSLCDVVENFDDLCNNFYACAGWQPYFDDFVNHCRCSNFTSGTVEFCQVNV